MQSKSDKKELQHIRDEKIKTIRESHPNLGPNLTRRELIQFGLLEGVAWVAIPGILSNLFRSQIAHAAVNFPALGIIQCNGGWASSGNVVPFMAGGAAIPGTGITTLGVPANVMSLAGAVVTPFSAPASGPGFSFFQVSKAWQTIQSLLTPAELACVQGLSVACRTQDDGGGSNNLVMFNAAAALAGLSGTVAPIMGNRNTPAGVENAGRLVNDAKYVSLLASSVNDIRNAVKVSTLPGITVAGMSQIAQTSRDLSGMHMNGLPDFQGAAQFRSLSQDAYQQGVDYINNPPSVDVREDATLNTIFGVTTATAANNAAAVYGSLVKCAVDGRIGSFAYEIGGCDYHAGTSIATADAKDVEIGTRIAQFIKAAVAKNKRSVLTVVSNGAVSGVSDRSVWSGDSGARTLFLMFVVTPPGMTKPNQTVAQLGAYGAQGTAITNNGIGGSDGMEAARAIFINYLSLAGMTPPQIQSRIPALSTGQVQSQIVFTV